MRLTVYSLGLFSILASHATQAAIIATSDSVQVISPPPSLIEGQLESDTIMHAFVERQGFLLLQDLNVDVTLPGTLPSVIDENYSPGIVPAGTFVDSYFVHVDSVTGNPVNQQVFYSGSITFDRDILGIVLRIGPLNASDLVLGNPATTYSNDPVRDLELVPGGTGGLFNDGITLSDDLRTITFDIKNGGSLDQFRVITAVPEASSIAMCAMASLGLLALGHRRRLTRRS